MLSIFSCACWQSAFLIWKNICSVLLHFKIRLFGFLMSSWMDCLYMLDINPFLVISFVKFFFHLTVPFVQKLFSLIRYHSFIFAFYFLCFGRRIKKKNCCEVCQTVFCLCFPLGILWHLVLRLGFNPFWVLLHMV